MLRNAAVRDVLVLNQRETARRLELDREKVLAGLVEAVDVARAQGDPGAMVRAWAEIGKMLGFYTPEKVLKVDVSITAKRFMDQLETLPEAELLGRMGATSPNRRVEDRNVEQSRNAAVSHGSWAGASV